MDKDVMVGVFARAFVMPRERFLKVVSENTNVKGDKCNVHEVAKAFGVEYMDAYIRGKELELWE